MSLRIILLGFVALLITGPAFAKGVPINPGEWEMTTTTRMSMSPQPQVETVTECVEASEMDPDAFSKDEEHPCNVFDIEVHGRTSQWSVSCPSEGGMLMQGQWEMISSGDALHGTGHLSADRGGMKMEFNMSFEGKRLGDCP